MKMVAGFAVVVLVVAAFPSSAFASSTHNKDVITGEAYENLVKSGAIKGVVIMTKTIISNPVLEEAKLGGSIFNCGETCILGTCYTPGCSCVYGACSKNSLQQGNHRLRADDYDD